VGTDLKDLIEAVIPPIEKLPEMVTLATGYFKSRSEEQRSRIKSLNTGYPPT